MPTIIPAIVFSLLVVYSIADFILRNNQKDAFELIPENIGKCVAWLQYRGVKRNSLEYYRDILTGVSPLLVGYLENYHLKYETDIAAILLKMYKDEKIDFQDGEVIKGKEEITSPDEIKVYNLIISKHTKDEKETKLEDEMYKEAKKSGYIAEEKSKSFPSIFMYIFSCLGACEVIVLAVLVSQSFIPSYGNVWKFSPLVAVAVTIAVLFAFFLYISTGYVNYNRGYVLTPKGADLREKIFGLKRFIKDFSMLSQKEKEDVMLWDDFLIYSVIFGQNKKIKRDILKHYNIDYKIIESMKA